MDLKTLKSLFETYRESVLFGRYIHTDSIAPLLDKFDGIFTIDHIGDSVDGLPIHSVTFGNGHSKILMWSQMHGNESTTTKAVFDMFNVFADQNFTDILKECTIKVIPILNPDGAKAYTRLNANEIDLNRDAQDLSQPESKVLRQVFEEFQPDFCFNLHGQRTIFSAGKSDTPATVSFLAPAQDIVCTVTDTRKTAMSLIAKMNNILQQQIGGQVGIYDDTFNLNCVGDTFQSMNRPTILFEAGHYPNDYQREQTREFIFQSLMVAIRAIASKNLSHNGYEAYFDIPMNEKLFYDIIIRNTDDGDIAIQYHEVLSGDSLKFVPKIEKITDLKQFYAHKEIDANGHQVFGDNDSTLKEGSEIVFVSINNEIFSLKL